MAIIKCQAKCIYWHMPDPLKEPNLASPIADKTGFKPVKVGDLIGYADNTGNSTGSHLHFGLKPVAKGEDWGTWYNIAQNNGYYGAVDPEPYLPKLDLGFTWNFTKNMKFGDKNVEVLMLQRLLKGLGYYDKGLDSHYGPATKVAVLAFQVAYKVCTPIESRFGMDCGPRTRRELNKLTN